MGRLAAQYYLHIHSGAWQWRIEPWATVELRNQLTHETVGRWTAVLVVHALAQQYAQAVLTAELLPQVRPPLPALRAPGPGDFGQPRLRRAEKRKLRGRKQP